MRIRHRLFVAFCSGLVAGTAAAGEDLAAIEEKIKTNWAKVKTLSASTRLEGELHRRDRVHRKTTTGTYLFLREEDGRERVRQELETHQDTDMHMGGDTTVASIPMNERSIMVADGLKIRSISEGGKSAKAMVRFQKGSGIVVGGSSLLETMHRGATLQVLPDSRFEGREAWAIQALKGKGYNKTLYLIDKEWGFLLQRVTYTAKDEDDVPATTFTMSRVSVNANDVTSEQLAFEFPPGTEVEDETRDE